MSNTLHLINRHLHLFLKRPSSLVLSIISAAIILSLYFLFIKDFMIIVLTDYGISTHATQIVDCIMCAGLLTIINCTSILSIVNLFIQDKVKGIIKDFYISPVSNTSIILSYVFAAIIISFFISLLYVCIIHGYLYFEYGFMMHANEYLKVFCIILLISCFGSILLFICALFIESFSAFSSISNLFSVLLGFINAVYIPIGLYPTFIRDILTHFPLAQLTALLRNIYTKDIFETCDSIYPVEAISYLKVHFGINTDVSYDIYPYIIGVCSFLLILLCILHHTYKKK